nr:hypothetical protein [Tanacetum cinerariifolium]
MHDGLGMATTTAFSLEAEQGSGNISKTQTKATSFGPSSPRTSLKGGLGCHITMGVVLFRLGLKGHLTCSMNHQSEKVTHLEVGMAVFDGQDKTITEATIRRHLKLADADGISTLPIIEFFEQLALMGKTRTRTRRIGIRIPKLNVPSSVVDEDITKEMHDGLGRATTTAFSLEAEQGS